VENAPVIVKKVVKRSAGHHGGAWKVAYADFVTAMMALFIVLWLVNSNEVVQKSVGGYFRDPTGSGNQTGSSLAGTGENLTVRKEDMSHLKEKIEGVLKSLPEFDQQLSKQVKMTVTGEGLRIELLETESGLFFEKGNARPTGSGMDLLKAMAGELSKMPNSILVEGHTDSRPFRGLGNYSNWELSVDRANMARRTMQEHGLRPDQVTQVRGYADQRLRTPETPEDPSNRRITVVVQYGQGQDELPQEEATTAPASHSSSH
jgi:chemotaxis protein MotB